MIIHYCEKCGVRVPEAEVESGAARVNDMGKATCAKCGPARRSTARLPGPATTRRETQSAIKPLRRDSKIRIEPAVAPPSPVDPEPVVEAGGTDWYRQPHILVGGAAAVIVMIVVLIMALGGSSEDKQAATEAYSVGEAKTQVSLPPNVSTTSTQPTKGKTEPVPVVQTKTGTDTYDPRATFAQSLLDQAKAFYRETPGDPWTYQEKLQAVVDDHGETKAGLEAKEILATLNPGPKPADPALPPEEAWEKARDLLALADPARHLIDGKWFKENNGLRSEKNGSTKLALPYIAPEEYDLRLGLARVEGHNNLCVNLTHVGQPLTFHLASWGNKVTGWEKLLDKRVNDISTTVKRNNLLKNNHHYTLIIQMRKNRWAAFLDGQLLVKRDGQVNLAISQHRELLFPNPTQLGLFTKDSSYRVDEIKVLEVTGTGKVIEPGEAVAVAQTPTKEDPPKQTEPANQPKALDAKRTAYAVWLTGFHGSLGERAWDVARRRLDDASKNRDLADKSAALKLDQECLALAESAQLAIPKGAESLKDGRTFTLTDRKDKKYTVGRKTKVLKADDKAVTIQHDVGGGQIVVDLALSELTDETLFGLARLGLPEESKSQVALALYRFSDYLKTNSPESRKTFDGLMELAEKAEAPAPLLEHIRGWLRTMEREREAGQALQGVEQLIVEQKGTEAQAALAEFVRNFGDTAFYAQTHPQIPNLQARIAKAMCQPGLVAKYYSGDSKDKKKNYHFDRTVKGLDHDWGGRGPADGVPADNFRVIFVGVLRIEQAGEYVFNWRGDDAVELWLDGTDHGRNKSNVKIELAAGDHRLRVIYTEGGGSANMSVKWQPPGAEKAESIPQDRLFHKPAEVEEEGK